MLQLYFETGFLVVGVTRGSIERLTAGQPLKIALLRQPVNEIAVVFGETKPEILRALEDAGIEVADVHKAAAAADPL